MYYGIGLSAIPEDVKSRLKKSLIEKLAKDGHGLSFPDPTHCQMRFSRGQETVSSSYSYIQYGSCQKAIEAAISRVEQLRTLHQYLNLTRNGGGVTFSQSKNKTNDKLEYRYSVMYTKHGKKMNKAFYMGSGAAPSGDKCLHAFRTAKLFKHHCDIYGDDIDIAWFSEWKHRRLYTLKQEPVDFKNI